MTDTSDFLIINNRKIKIQNLSMSKYDFFCFVGEIDYKRDDTAIDIANVKIQLWCELIDNIYDLFIDKDKNLNIVFISKKQEVKFIKLIVK